MKLTLISVLFIILLCRNINFTNATEYTIYLIDNGFNPKSITANVGDTVRFWDASIVDKFNRTTVRQIVQAVGDASGCMQSTDPGAFSISVSSLSPKSTVSLGSAGTISFFCNGQCQNGFWGSIEINGPNGPNSPLPGNSTSPTINPSPSGDSSSISHSTPPAGNSPYIEPAMKAPKLATWKLVLISIGSISAIVLTLVVTYFTLRNKSAEQSKVTTDSVTVNPDNTNTNVDSNNTKVDSNDTKVDSNNTKVDSNDTKVDVDSNNVDSNNVNTSNVDSNDSNSNVNANNVNNDNNV